MINRFDMGTSGFRHYNTYVLSISQKLCHVSFLDQTRKYMMMNSLWETEKKTLDIYIIHVQPQYVIKLGNPLQC